MRKIIKDKAGRPRLVETSHRGDFAFEAFDDMMIFSPGGAAELHAALTEYLAENPAPETQNMMCCAARCESMAQRESNYCWYHE